MMNLLQTIRTLRVVHHPTQTSPIQELRSWCTTVMIQIPLLLPQLNPFMIHEYRMHLNHRLALITEFGMRHRLCQTCLLPRLPCLLREASLRLTHPKIFYHHNRLRVTRSRPWPPITTLHLHLISLQLRDSSTVFTTFLGSHGNGSPLIIDRVTPIEPK